MRIHLIYFTENGRKLSEIIKTHWNTLHELEIFSGTGENKTSLATFSARAFQEAEAILFLSATGIAVRAIAPHVKNKLEDPAVLSIDDSGSFVIPLLSGHWGGGNALCTQLADLLGACPVVTTATDRNGLFAVDSFAKRENMTMISGSLVKKISSSLLRGETQSFYSRFPVQKIPPELKQVQSKEEADFIIDSHSVPHKLCLIPKTFVLGIGCRKETDPNSLAVFVEEFLADANISKNALCSLASIHIKKEELAILSLAQQWNLPFFVYSTEELAKQQGNFHHSDFVFQQVGVGNVCERACFAAGGTSLHSPRRSHPLHKGITLALAEKPLPPLSLSL